MKEKEKEKELFIEAFSSECHIQFCSVLCYSGELSFCPFMRHSNVNLWTWCQFLCLDLCPWPWLHIYIGMSADSLSCWVNIPPDLLSVCSDHKDSLQSYSSPCLRFDKTKIRLPYAQRLSVVQHFLLVMQADVVFRFFPSDVSLPALQQYKGLFADVWSHTAESTPHRWQRDDVKVLGITLVNSRGIGVHS